MTDQELRAWALERYGSEALANDLELARLVYEDDEFVAAHGNIPWDADDEMPYARFMADLDDLLRRASTFDPSLRGEGRKAL
jgi:hypothetical protein